MCEVFPFWEGGEVLKKVENKEKTKSFLNSDMSLVDLPRESSFYFTYEWL